MNNKIALINATPAGFNPGMLFSDVMAHSFVERHSFAAVTTHYRFVPIEDRLASLGSELRERTIARVSEAGFKFSHLEDSVQLKDATPLYWGDWLHMRQYLKGVSNFLPRGEIQAARVLLLDGAPPELLSRAVSFGTTFLFNTGSDLASHPYGTLLRRFVRGSKLVLARDIVSAGQIEMLIAPDERPTLGLDVTQLVTLLQDWRSAFPAQARHPTQEPGVGLCFFGRGMHDPRIASDVLARLTGRLGVTFRWLPWGDDTGFALQHDLTEALGLETIGQTLEPPLFSLLDAVAKAPIVVTDAYHLAVIAWSLGVPTLTLLGSDQSSTVNAGHAHARVDKRFIFHAQHGLLEFLIDDASLGDPASLVSRLGAVARHLEDGEIAVWHRAVVRQRAKWCEAKLKLAIGQRSGSTTR